MPLNDFYTVLDLSPSPDSLKCSIRYNAEHAIFSGHFPGHPIVPGVCTMQMIGELLALVLSSPLILQSASSIKYLQLITPAMQPAARVSWLPDDGLYKVSAMLTDGGNTLFKMSGTFAAAVPANAR